MDIQKILAVTLLLSLSACGGGGSSPSVTTPPSTTPPTTATPPIGDGPISVYVDQSPQQHQSIGMVALANSLSVANVHWTIVSAPFEFDLLASNSQVVSFDASQSGNYQFSVEITTTSGSQYQQAFDIDVEANSNPTAQLRLDHEVVEQGKVSLRADTHLNYNISSTQWQQISGPSVTTEVIDNTLFFDAPSVTQDTLLEFKATLSLPDGNTITDNAFVLVKNASINNNAIFPQYAEQIVTTSAHAYRENGPYADVLVDCVYDNLRESTCNFNRLPLLGMETINPSIEDILNRVVVSHDWMGQRFEEFLLNSAVSDDMLNLLRATTAIVISYDVRPSFYWTATGAIYLDADNFWRTPAERDTLNDAPDYRASFGNELQFDIAWYYLADGDLAFSYSDPAFRLDRNFSDMESEVTWLMYHELAHANDYIAPSRWASLSNSSNPLQAANATNSISDGMAGLYPLQQSELTALANVSFSGETASAAQKAYTPSEISDLFKTDRATDYYSYSTEAEDLAMFFQHLMLDYRLDYVSVVAVLDNDNIVDWGEFSRVDHQHLQTKARYVVDRILPEVDTNALMQQLNPVGDMQPGVSFVDSMLAGRQAKPSQNRPQLRLNKKIQQHAAHIGRPKLH